MPARLRPIASVAAAVWLAVVAVGPVQPRELTLAAANEPVTPLVAPRMQDAKRIALGRELFHDPRLSQDGTVACASCHQLDHGGADGLPLAVGAGGRTLPFNTPTVFNAAANFRLNWRGEFRTIEQQNEAVLLDPRIMGTSWEQLLPRLRADPLYRTAFTRLYGGAPGRDSVLDALAAFQRSLVTTGSRFDRYLMGDRSAITAEEEKGYRLFKEYGCVACHQGSNLGGNLFQKFGIFVSPFARKQVITDADLGRFTVTRAEEDRHVFRVPGLRNVAVTAPYLHDGRAPTLSRAVEIMARNQLGRDLRDDEVDLIVRFLGTLTGEFPQADAITGGP